VLSQNLSQMRVFKLQILFFCIVQHFLICVKICSILCCWPAACQLCFLLNNKKQLSKIVIFLLDGSWSFWSWKSMVKFWGPGYCLWNGCISYFSLVGITLMSYCIRLLLSLSMIWVKTGNWWAMPLIASSNWR